MKNLKFITIAVLGIALILSVSSCKSSWTPAERYAHEHKDENYDSWLKRHTPLFGWGDARIERAKGFAELRKEAAKKAEKEEKVQAEIAKYNAKEY